MALYNVQATHWQCAQENEQAWISYELLLTQFTDTPRKTLQHYYNSLELKRHSFPISRSYHTHTSHKEYIYYLSHDTLFRAPPPPIAEKLPHEIRDGTFGNG